MVNFKKTFSCFTSAMMVMSIAAFPVNAADGTATGTQVPYVVGDDWGCGVSKTVMTLDKTIDAESVQSTDFSVKETKPVYGGEVKTFDRKILNAYTSDDKGNQVTTNSDKVTIEMYVSPDEGSPFVYSGRNNWCDPYELDVSIVEGQDMTAGAEKITTLDVEKKLTPGTVKICPQVEKFEVKNDGFKSSKGNTISYALYKPSDDGKKHPLVMWNHGAGEYGTDVQIDMLGNEVTALAGDEFQKTMGGAYVIVPQRRIGDTDTTTTEDVYELIQKVLKENPNIDSNRIIEGGCSAGGGFTMQMLYAYPDLFAAAYPICPASYSEKTTDEQIESIKDVPIWFIHAANDPVVKIDQTTTPLAERLEKAGAEVHTSVFEDVHDTTGRFDTDGKPYQYNGHWSWIYFDNNECNDDKTGENLWQWMAKQTKEVTATGTQKINVIGDDWGPAVNKTVIKLDRTINADSIDEDDFSVVEEKSSTNWGDGSVYTGQYERNVLDAYPSDEKGNRVESDSEYITIEMYVSPNEGNPFRYDLKSGFNDWCQVYNLIVTLDGELTSGNKTVGAVDVKKEISLSADTVMCEQLEKFNLHTKAFTASNGTTYSYADFIPETKADKQPLVIWLHGAGEGKYDPSIDLLGNEVTAMAGDEFQEKVKDAVILTPQCPTMWMDDGTGQYQNGDKGSYYKESLMEFIKYYVKNNKNIDENRIYIGGCSNGGYMTMEMVLNYPEYFAAAFPICEAFQDQYITDEQIESIKDLPIWFVYANNDPTVNPDLCEKPTIERLKKAGASNLHVSEFEDVHDTTGRFNLDGNPMTSGNANTRANIDQPYQYSGHWSWIYWDNNECYDENGVNAWEWLGQQAKTVKVDEDKPAASTTKPTNTTTDSKKPTSGSKVKTGDDASYVGFALLMMASAGAFAEIKRRRNKA